VPGIMNECDIEDIVRLIAPRALYISATEEDKYSRGAKEIFDYALDAFPASKLQLKVWGGGHVFTDEMRKCAYKFLNVQL